MEIKHSKRRTVRLLRQLQEVLRKVPKEKFDMESWASDGPNLQDITQPVCATAACAAGWATTMPAMRRIGFHLIPDPTWGGNLATIKFGDAIGWKAFSNAFGLSEFNTDDITMSSNYTLRMDEAVVTPAMVIARIDEVIARL